MLTVTAVLRHGGEYTEWHLSRLYSLILPLMPDGFLWQPVLDSPWPGYWSKISLFEPGRFTGRVLYLDLDTTPLADLSALAETGEPFVAIADWWHPCLNSSVMAWTPSPETERIFTEFKDAMVGTRGGDQVWITRMMPNAATFPANWVPSYKATVRRWKVLPPDARVCVHHGQPRPWSLPADYLERYRVG